MDILPQTACIVFSIIMAYNVASLFIAQLWVGYKTKGRSFLTLY